MGLLNDLGKKISETGQGAMRGAKNLTETVRLNSMISDEKSKINNCYVQIGKTYYENRQEDIPEPYKESCAQIDESFRKIAEYEEEIQKIKSERICENCGAEVDGDATSCSKCGTPVAQQQSENVSEKPKFCPSCGAAIQQESPFCSACGLKL